MEAGFSSYAMGWATTAHPADAGTVLDRAISLGYRRVQLADNVPLHTLNSSRRGALKKHADRAGVAIEVGARGLTQETIASYLKIAVEFNSPFLRIVIDARDYTPDTAEVIRLLHRQRPLLARAKVVLAIENHDRFKARELAHIIEEVGSPWVGICLDTANSLGAAEDLATVTRALGAHTVNVHLKDVRIRRVPSLQGFMVDGTPLGEGDIDLAGVLQKLRRHGRCHSATLEHWVPPEPELAATLRKEQEWCVRSTTKMRQLFPLSFTRT